MRNKYLQILGKPTMLVGEILLLTPVWLAIILALLPGFLPNLGMVVGLTLPFWGMASLIGWVVFLVASISVRNWLIATVGTLTALLLNGAALLGLREIEEIKMRHQFSENKQLLAEIGNKLLNNILSLEEARVIVAAHKIDFTPKLVSREGNCMYVFFHAFGALDSQLGYYYLPTAIDGSKCREIRCAAKVGQVWCYGAL